MSAGYMQETMFLNSKELGGYFKEILWTKDILQRHRRFLTINVDLREQPLSFCHF